MSALPIAAVTPRPKTVYLYPGEVFAAGEPVHVSTILGSCVAICLWDPVRKVGGLNHFLLPQPIGADQGSTKFSAPALRALLSKLAALGSTRESLQAHVYGGARVMKVSLNVGRHLGQENVDAAFAGLAKEGIRVLDSRTGGSRGLRLLFSTIDGSVQVRELQ